MIPNSITALFWDSNPQLLDPDKHKKSIIVRTLNYGTLSDWKWLKEKYGAVTITSTALSEGRMNIRQGAQKLAQIIFA